MKPAGHKRRDASKKPLYQGKYSKEKSAASELSLQELFEAVRRVEAGYAWPTAREGKRSKRDDHTGAVVRGVVLK